MDAYRRSSTRESHAPLRNIVFISLVSIVLSCLILGLLGAKGSIDFPKWTNIGSDESYLEGRSYAPFPTPNASSALNGTLQSQLDEYCSDHIPFRDSASIGAAMLQQTTISASASLFGFDSMPTYYGSSTVKIESQQAVSGMPTPYSLVFLDHLETFGAQLVAAAAQYPSKRFIVCMPAGDNTPDQSPLFSLSSSPMPPAMLAERLGAILSAADNITFVSDAGSYDTLEDYYCYYYKNDHHWNMRGVLRSYNQIAQQIGLESLEDAEVQSIGTHSFIGPTARGSRCLLPDTPLDVAIDFSDIEMHYPEAGEVEKGSEHRAFYDADTERRMFDFEQIYFSTAPLYIGPGEGKALLLCDSFGSQISRLLANQYKEMRQYPDMRSKNTEGILTERIDESNPDDIYIIATAYDLQSLPYRIPSYLTQ